MKTTLVGSDACYVFQVRYSLFQKLQSSEIDDAGVKEQQTTFCHAVGYFVRDVCGSISNQKVVSVSANSNLRTFSGEGESILLNQAVLYVHLVTDQPNGNRK